jgi:hypothetical protein
MSVTRIPSAASSTIGAETGSPADVEGARGGTATVTAMHHHPTNTGRGECASLTSQERVTMAGYRFEPVGPGRAGSPAGSPGPAERRPGQHRLDHRAIVDVAAGQHHRQRPPVPSPARWILVVGPPRDRPTA